MITTGDDAFYDPNLEEAGIRVDLDLRNKKIGYKMRQVRNERVSYLCVMGEQEAKDGTLSVRSPQSRRPGFHERGRVYG